MKTIADLLTTAQPSIVAMQSAVLVLFMISFVTAVFYLTGEKKRKECDELARRMLEE